MRFVEPMSLKTIIQNQIFRKIIEYLNILIIQKSKIVLLILKQRYQREQKFMMELKRLLRYL